MGSFSAGAVAVAGAGAEGAAAPSSATSAAGAGTVTGADADADADDVTSEITDSARCCTLLRNDDDICSKCEAALFSASEKQKNIF